MKYVFVVEVKHAVAVEVEAESVEAAIAKAKECEIRDMCAQCSAPNTPEVWSGGDVDREALIEGELVDLHLYGDGATHVDCEALFERAADAWEADQ